MRLDPTRETWMVAPETRAVMRALVQPEGKARFVGGAVRNALLKKPVADIDIATPLLPGEVTRRLQAAGLAVLPTGIEHGTVTAIARGKPFEITTLRRDVTTDGRRAIVAFTTDWKEDGARRDFTINALYASPSGDIFDYFGGVADLNAGRVRFVGDPTARIREDYLRILRLFRFHAWYGKGNPGRDAVRAASNEKTGLARLSGERIQKELLKLLEADDPGASLRTMDVAGILGAIVPPPLDLPRLQRLVSIDRSNSFQADALLRLAALLSADVSAADAIADRLKLSNADRNRLEDLAGAKKTFGPGLPLRDARKLLYRLGAQRFVDRVRLHWAEDLDEPHATQWRSLLELARSWRRPVFPLSGRDVMAAGVPEGPAVGGVLAKLEEWWIETDFSADRSALTERLNAAVRSARREHWKFRP